MKNGRPHGIWTDRFAARLFFTYPTPPPSSRSCPPGPVSVLPRPPEHQIDQLLVHRLGAAWLSRTDGAGGAVLEVIAQEGTGDTPKRLLHRAHLGDHVGTVALLLDHLLQSTHLAFDTPETGEHARLELGVDRDRVTLTVGAGAAGAGCHRVLGHRKVPFRVRS